MLLSRKHLNKKRGHEIHHERKRSLFSSPEHCHDSPSSHSVSFVTDSIAVAAQRPSTRSTASLFLKRGLDRASTGTFSSIQQLIHGWTTEVTQIILPASEKTIPGQFAGHSGVSNNATRGAAVW